MAIYVFQGAKVSPHQHQLLGAFGAIMVGAFSVFLPGSIGLHLTSPSHSWVRIGVKATGSLAIVIFFLWWWKASSPIIVQKSEVRVEITNLISELDAKFQSFKLDLLRARQATPNDAQFASASSNALANASIGFNKVLDKLLLDSSLNHAERALVTSVYKQPDNEALSDTSLVAHDIQGTDPPTFLAPTNSKPIPEMRRLLFSPFDIRPRMEGIPSSVVISYDQLNDSLKDKLSRELANGFGKFGEYYFVKTPDPEKKEPRISYVGTDSEDMPECAKFIRVVLDNAESGLGSSLTLEDLPMYKRPHVPDYEQGYTTLWAPDETKTAPHTGANGKPAISFSLRVLETGVQISSARSRTDGRIMGGLEVGTKRDGNRTVWVYLP